MDPDIEITSERVRQRCPACGETVGEAGVFAMSENATGEKLRILIRADDILIGEKGTYENHPQDPSADRGGNQTP
jgi:hypothetical protein